MKEVKVYYRNFQTIFVIDEMIIRVDGRPKPNKAWVDHTIENAIEVDEHART